MSTTGSPRSVWMTSPAFRRSSGPPAVRGVTRPPPDRPPSSSLLDAPSELLLRRLGHLLGRPRGVPDDLDGRLLDAREALDLALHVRRDVGAGGAPGGREGHPHEALLLLDVHVGHEPQVDDVNRDLGVIALLEDADDLVLAHREESHPPSFL